MSVILEVNGKQYANWTEVEVTRSLKDISGVFSFVAASDSKIPFPIARMQSVRVLINNQPVITGFIDRIVVNYNFGSHYISVEGRDRTCDVVDSKVDHEIEFKAPVTLDQVIEETLSAINVPDIKVINKVSDLEPYKKGELISAHIGQGAYEFMDQYAKKRQVVLTTDGKGNIVVTRASTESTKIKLLNKTINPSTQNNILSASVTYDDSERYHEYNFYSQGNPSGDKDLDDDVKKLTMRTGSWVDEDVRPSRTYHEIAESSNDDETSEERSKWEGQIRKAKSMSYSCTVVGHSPFSEDGKPYEPNTLITVADDFSDVNLELLIIDVKYRLAVYGGSTTELKLMTREAFNILNEHDTKKLKKSTKGSDKDDVEGAPYSSIYEKITTDPNYTKLK